MDMNLMVPFSIAILTFLFIPGPGNFYCGAQSLTYGTRVGLKVAFGLHIGGYVHVIAASLGLSILFETIPIMFVIMKLTGAGLLIWMGMSLWRKHLQGEHVVLPATESSSFSRAFMVEALNPTTALFFVAFLPQFVSLNGTWPLSVQFLILGTIVGLVFSITDVIYAIAAGGLHRRLKSSARLQAWIKRIGGTVLIGLGINIAVS